MMPKVALSAFVLFCVTAVASADPPAGFVESIEAERLRAHVEYLASDELEGRLTGTEGARLAGEYIAKQFEEAGLEPAGDDGTWYQNFSGVAQIGFVRGQNVIGVIRGSDEKLKNEYVVIGAHRDHLGRGAPWSFDFPNNDIHNGADDNASGTSALIEIARAFAGLETPVKRTVIFIAFDAEELGAEMGSSAYVDDPKFPLEDTVFMLNMDMVGRLRNGYIEIVGASTGTGLREFTEQVFANDDVDLNFLEKMVMNSDHYSFYKHSVPDLYFFTGTHEDYHRATDDVQYVNFEGMELIGRRSATIAYHYAETAERMEFHGGLETTALGGLDLLEGAQLLFGGRRTEPEVNEDRPGDRQGLIERLRRRLRDLIGGRE
ncbi:MAG: M28 family peptidase [Planctomycetes bacterium]|nr:M28 family peptidase [Planctomycetota bacterium]